MFTYLLVISQKFHGKHSHDSDEGPQKFHTDLTPRIGGVAMYFSLVVPSVFSAQLLGNLLAPMLLAVLPSFAAGFAEDISKRVSPTLRLVATIVSGFLGWWFTGYHLMHLEIWGVDSLLAHLYVSVAFTAFAVAGLTNAINMIDGFNGLASGTLMILFFAFGLIAMEAGDVLLSQLCLMLIVVLGGFLVFNFPFGKIFMGDGGAYLMGFFLAWIAVMLPMRNPEVSVWASLLVCAYPINEALFTMLRRAFIKVSVGQPDREHLHSLFKIKVIRIYFSQLPQYLRSSLVAPFCWGYAALASGMAVWHYNRTDVLVAAWFSSFIVYAIIYFFLKYDPVSPVRKKY
ncbi:MAG: glycosyl transferase [Chlorobium sp.]|nr:MAG: glycosyl transferase [Chlorobium sp.]